MLSVVCSNCHVPVSVVIQSSTNGITMDQMRCVRCGQVWIASLPNGTRTGIRIEPYARKRPDRRTHPR